MNNKTLPISKNTTLSLTLGSLIALIIALCGIFTYLQTLEERVQIRTLNKMEEIQKPLNTRINYIEEEVDDCQRNYLSKELFNEFRQNNEKQLNQIQHTLYNIERKLENKGSEKYDN